MNKPLGGAALERALKDRLQALLGEIGWLSELPSPVPSRSDGPDATIHLASESGNRAALHVWVKTEMRPSTFLSWSAPRASSASAHHAVPVLALPHVSPRMAQLCRREHWSWLDLSGNCWIDVPGQVRIERAGNDSVRRPHKRRANLGTAASARVLRVLLSPAHAGFNWTQRDLRKKTCRQVSNDRPVSLGLVNRVVRHLRDEGYVSEAEDSGVRVSDAPALLRAWSEEYRLDQHERRSYFTLLRGPQLVESLYRTGLEAGGRALYAAFSAAERQAPQVRRPKTWLYVASEYLGVLERHAQAKPVDSGENLVVLVPEDSGVFLSFEADGHVGDRTLGCTDPVQTYVDLLQCGGRGEEAAQAVLEQRLLLAWRAVGAA